MAGASKRVTFEIALVLLILLVAIVLFATEWVRMDVTALVVLCLLAVSGLISSEQALSGFSHPAVITIWAMFILSEGLTRAGIADVIGQRLVNVTGDSELRQVLCLMLLAGALSSVMNNVGVTALLLPVTAGIARQTGNAPSRLLMPMAFGCLLGGAITLIGTPPNLLVSTALGDAGFAEFRFFDFAPLGIPVLIAGTLFMAFVGRHLLPRSDPISQLGESRNLRKLYSLQERIFAVEVPAASPLIGRSIADSGLLSAAGLMIIALTRAGRTQALPSSGLRLQQGDILLAQGRLDRFNLLQQWSELIIEREAPLLHEKLLGDAGLYEIGVSAESPLCGSHLAPAEFWQRHGVWLLAVRRGKSVRRTRLAEWTFSKEDCLLLQGEEGAVQAVREKYRLTVPEGQESVDKARLDKARVLSRYQLDERLLVLRVPADAELVGRTVGESRLDKAFDLRLLALFREGSYVRPVPAEQTIQGADLLLVQGRLEDFDLLRGLQCLRLLDDATPYLRVFEQGELAMVEATIHPHTSLNGRTVADLKLRETWQIELAAIWRGGRPFRSGLKDMELQRGDALLLVGPVKQLAKLSGNPDLIVLNPLSVVQTNTGKAPLAVGLMLLVVAIALSGLLPVSVAAIIGATLMVLTRCLSMEEAYRSIHWRSVFLVAGMIPLGYAMHETGAAAFLTERLLVFIEPYGPWVVIASLFWLTVAGTLIIPTIVLVLLMAPIALTSSIAMGVQPQAAMMAIALAAAASVASPVAHPTNVLVMGPGAYRFSDFLKLGLPLTLVIFLVSAVLMPLVWPL